MPGRIVSYVHRYRRPPRKKPAAPLAGSAIVTQRAAVPSGEKRAASVVRGVGRSASSGPALTARQSPLSPVSGASADGTSRSASRRAAAAPSTSAVRGRRCTRHQTAAGARCPPSLADAANQVVLRSPVRTSQAAASRQGGSCGPGTPSLPARPRDRRRPARSSSSRFRLFVVTSASRTSPTMRPRMST